MKNFCKKMLFWPLALFLAFFAGCTNDANTTFELRPDQSVDFVLWPNDYAPVDSADAHMSHGVAMVVHPNTHYQLSFVADVNYGAPTLHLFKHYRYTDGHEVYSFVKVVSPTLVDGRYRFDFACEERNVSEWVGTLEYGETFYQGTTRNVHLDGFGSYSDHLSLNLIVVGNVPSMLKDFTIQDVADSLLAGYRKFYKGITIDTLYVNYANEHPTLGKKYPANKSWIAGKSSDDMMLTELGGWPGVESALDLVMSYYINENGVMGYSNLFSGNLGGGDNSTLTLGSYYLKNGVPTAMSLKEIVNTAVHESGHFFGLRHTTSSKNDIKVFGDLSSVEDGLEDTPYCEAMRKSGLYKKVESSEDTEASESGVTDFRLWTLKRIALDYAFGGDFGGPAPSGSRFDISVCLDKNNLMFPYDDDTDYEGFSDMQLDIIRRNLMIFAH